MLHVRDDIPIGKCADTPSAASGLHVPPGAPSWITPELVADTLETWQPYYEQDLTAADALEILLSVGNLINVLEKPA